MIKLEHFSYQYGAHRAVDDISFELKKGELAALIGPNGAGKSTTMKVLTTLLRPCAGKVTVAGYDVVQEPMKVRKNLGYLPETNPLYTDMLVYDALQSIAAQRLIPRGERKDAIALCAQQCGIVEVMHRPIQTLSRGYRQRVGLAQAILHQPEVLILDEATTGLDPNQIREIRDLIVDIGKDRTVLMSTHILQEVTAIAKRVIILNHGKIACDGEITSLLADLAQTLGRDDVTLEDLFVYYTKEGKSSHVADLSA